MLSKKVLISALFATAALYASAQSSTNSPYTRFGFGDLSDRVFTNNAAMGGVGYALRSNRHINTMNPAAYTSVDSLSFMFDLGFSLKSSNYKEGEIKANAKNSTFDYLAMQFRLHPRIGFSMGFIPYSNVGYNFSSTSQTSGSNTYDTNTFTGDGGTNIIYAGLGFKILKNLSVGANIGYLYGKNEYSTTITFSNGGDPTINYFNSKIKSYKLDLGVQYTQPINKDNSLTLGFTYELGHDVNATTIQGTQVTDGSSYNAKNEKETKGGYSIPSSYGAGIAYQYKNKLTVSADYTFQNWSDAKHIDESFAYNNRSKIAVGAEYVPDMISRKFLRKLSYRLGAYYTSPYTKIRDGKDGQFYDGAKEYGVTGGFGFPLTLFQRKTMLSITGQYIKLSPSAGKFMSEDRFVLKIGLTLNEPWFMKWKVN